MVEVIIPSYVIFHLADLEFEHKMDETPGAVVAGEIRTNREIDLKLVSSYKYLYNILM